MRYGTRAWLESLYDGIPDDPWGLDWRPSQQFRYASMLAALRQITEVSWVPQRIVDMGCATGSFTALLAGLSPDAGTAVIGIDIVESAIARASARYPDIAFKRMALDECAAEYSMSADLVTCLEVLYYLPSEERPAALRALRSMLRPGGILLVSSMISGAPYMSLAELRMLVENELPVIDMGVLYLKPVVLWEKVLMRWRRMRRTPAHQVAAPVNIDRIARISDWSRRLLGSYAQSHAFVVARLA